MRELSVCEFGDSFFSMRLAMVPTDTLVSTGALAKGPPESPKILNKKGSSSGES